MGYKILFFLILTLAVAICQVTFLNSATWFLTNLNLLIIILVLLVNIARPRNALIFALLSGALMDIFSSLPFGVYLFTFLVVFLALEFLLLNFFTNRSLYSLALLGAVATIVYHLIFAALAGALYLFGLNDFFITGGYWLALFWQLIVTVAVLGICFWLINRRSKIFKPTFLRT